MNHQYAIDELSHLVAIKEIQVKEHEAEGRHFDAQRVRRQLVDLRETVSFLQIEDMRMAQLEATMKGSLPK